MNDSINNGFCPDSFAGSSMTCVSPVFSVCDGDEVLLVGDLPELSDNEDSNNQSYCYSYLGVFRELSWRKRLIVLICSLVIMFSSICYSIGFSFLPFESEQKGVYSSFVVGMIQGCFEITVFVACIIFGVFISKIGIWFMFLCGIFVEGFCTFLFGVLEWCPPGNTFITLAVVVRVVSAIGASMCQTAGFAIIAEEFPQQATTFVGVLEAFEGIGLMTGPPLGGLLYQSGGFKLPYFVAGSTLVLCCLISIFLRPYSSYSSGDDSATITEHVRCFFQLPHVYLSGLMILTSAILITFYNPTLPVVLSDNFAMSPATIGLVFLLDAVTYSFVAPIVGYLSDRWGRNYVLLVIGNFGFLASYLLMGPLPWLHIPPKQLWTIILAVTLVGIFVSFGFTPTFAIMMDGAEEDGLPSSITILGLVSGFFSSVFSFGAFIGPILGGYLTDSLGFAWASSVMCVVPLVNLVSLALFCLWRRSSSLIER